MNNLQSLYETRAKCARYESEVQYALDLCETVGFLSWFPRWLLGAFQKEREKAQAEIDEILRSRRAGSESNGESD